MPTNVDSLATRIEANHAPSCRFCGNELNHSFVDLGMQPLCESYVSADQLNHMEPFYPLHAYVCSECFLVQLEEYVSPQNIFSEYAYFSSYSDSWIQHAKRYVDTVVARFHLDSGARVVEIASNDGYLLQHFVQRGIPVLGIEPAANVAKVAVERGIATKVVFFGEHAAQEIVSEHGRADLIVGNNVLAHVPALNDFVAGIKVLLKPGGVVTMEFPHLFKLIEFNQFDTIYHEHFSYISFTTAEKIFAAHSITLFDVEELETHGGSLRIYGRHDEDDSKPETERLLAMRTWEEQRGVGKLDTYLHFEDRVRNTKIQLLEFLITAKKSGATIAGYGAPGKGNTLLNYCGIRQDFLDYTVDRSSYKQGKYTPGTHIPIHHPDKIRETRPNYVLILPWNLEKEILSQLQYVREWGGKFVVPIPEVKTLL
jgi:SAM-dependent methyltransferase